VAVFGYEGGDVCVPAPAAQPAVVVAGVVATGLSFEGGFDGGFVAFCQGGGLCAEVSTLYG